MNIRQGLIVLGGLCLASPVAMAQTHTVVPPSGLKSAAATATAAQQSGRPLPLVPPTSVQAGQARPHIWVAGQLARLQGAAPLVGQGFAMPGGATFLPSDLLTAYGVNKIVGANGGRGITIAIVDAFHEPNAESNLADFNHLFGLAECTTANGCFRQVGQTGGAPPALLASDYGWDLEINLDIQWAHAMAPNAKILLVEADDNYFENLFPAIQYAVANADIVSNSWGGEEYYEQTYWDSNFLNSTKPIFASSGDGGSPASYPCTSPWVTCVGGTSLALSAASQRVTEVGWTGSGGSCSRVEVGSPWQAGLAPACYGFRPAPDIAALADPNTGVAVVMSPNLYKAGGTSLSAPLVAGIFADIMAARQSFGKSKFTSINPVLYSGAARNYPYFYFDVTSGSNGSWCCKAGPGYDLVTGLGVPSAPAMANRFFGLLP